MAQVAASDVSETPNHPLALRMGVIAGISHNMVVGCIMGSFSVLAASATISRMGLTTEQALLGGPLVMLGSSLAAPVIGVLVARRSLRLTMLGGALLAILGFALLAFAPSAPVYFGAYLLLFGPGMMVAGSIGPATLVTRWFDRNRGLALGLVHVNLVVALMPPLCVWLLDGYGPVAVYGAMAAMIALILVPALLVARDYPPGSRYAAAASTAAAATRAPDELTLGQIVRQPVFWCLAATASAIIAGIMVMTFTMVPYALSLGFSEGQGAFLLTIQSLTGMAGSILFGIVADKIGGFRGLALLAFDFAILLILLTLNLPYPAMIAVVAALGLHGAGMVPNVSRALAAALGQGSFSRAFGMSSFLSVPFTAAGVYGVGLAHQLTGSYSPALLALAALLLLTVPLALVSSRLRVSPA